MRCIRPIKAGFNTAGNITYDTTKMDPSIEPFAFECRKCLPCKLNGAREKAIRCQHEARYQERSCFITLTYENAKLTSPKLQYDDFRLFMRRLNYANWEQDNYSQLEKDYKSGLIKTKKELHSRQQAIRNKHYITYMVTGEYGEENKRPHWHAILFNYDPPDKKYLYTNDLGDDIYTSQHIEKLWGKNDPNKSPTNIGDVNMRSAGYVARYAAKKLVHGKDDEHDYHPIHKTTSKRAIGRTWIEKHWKHTFENGFIILPNGEKSKIPRYYIDWLRKYKEAEWIKYENNVKVKTQELAEKNKRKEELEYLSTLMSATGGKTGHHPKTRAQVKLTCLKAKFKQLQEELKL